MKHSITFGISKKEINRRIIAYTTLITSFFFSLIIISFNYVISYINISLYIILILALLLLLSKVLVVRYFNSILNHKIILNSEYIDKNNNKYLIKDIKQIDVKRTSNNYIREIKIILYNKKITFINGIDNFEEFNKNLLEYLSKNTIIKDYKEPIDYDHPLFYFFFGILVGLVSFISIKLLIKLNIYQLKIIYYGLSIFTIIFGLYFIVDKPIYKRDAKNNQITDYIWGIFFIGLGILTFFIYKTLV